MSAPANLLHSGWRFALTQAGQWSQPSAIDDQSRFRVAIVPGTVAGALRALNDLDLEAPPPLDDLDIWYCTSISGDGAHDLIFEGLAGIAEVWLDEALILASDNMFITHEVPVDLSGTHQLSLCFRALNPVLAQKTGRARWRPRMIQPNNLRHVRQSALGHMAGFAPPAPIIGPWRAIRLQKCGKADLRILSMRTAYKSGTGTLDVVIAAQASSRPQLHCAGHYAAFTQSEPGQWRASLVLPGIAPWFPHTHGTPHLHDAHIQIDGINHALGRTGFRSIAIDRDSDDKGFGITINEVPVFCRGACWIPLDPIGMQPTSIELEQQIALARNGGMNMLRLSGVFTYESDDFFAACDAQGIMVWQDFMFANFDYPAADTAFMQNVEAEVAHQLQRTQSSPSLVVLCGGNEVFQQAAMMGLAQPVWHSAFAETTLRNLAHQHRPDLPYVANSPSGGTLPFSVDEGVSHYYGVGAYRRPLEDARRANVRFATECLGFANVPETRALSATFGLQPLSHPLWPSRIPRDAGASYEFQEVRDHYTALLYDVDPVALRDSDPQHALDLARATTAEVAEATLGEWRRHGSITRGALVWFGRDLWPSSGWGIIDSTGVPKSIWHGFRRVAHPVQVIITDEGVNGLHIHLVNERPQACAVRLDVSCIGWNEIPVMRGQREMVLPPNSASHLIDTELWGAFFDAAFAFRFGPAPHVAVCARLNSAENGEPISESWFFPQGRKAAMLEPLLGVTLDIVNGKPMLRITTDRFAQSIKIEDENARPLDNWFHLAPGVEKIVGLEFPSDVSSAKPRGIIKALGSAAIAYSV